MIRRRDDFKKAIAHYEREEYNKAIELFEHMVGKNPQDMDARYNLEKNPEDYEVKEMIKGIKKVMNME